MAGYDVVFVSLLSVASALTALLNMIICILVFTHKHLRTCTNGFLVSLAFSDVLTGGVLMPLLLAAPTSPITGYFISIILLAGVANHVCITFDRFVAVCYPFHYASIVKAYSLRIITASWFIAVLTSLLPLCWATSHDVLVHKVYIFTELSVFILAPYVLVFLAYYRIFNSLLKHKKSLKEANVTSSRREEARRVSTEAKVARIFLVLVLMFVLCWLPIIYMTAVDAMGFQHLIPPSLMTVSFVTLILASLVNPLLYSFMKDDFRNAFKRLFQRRNRGVVNPKEGAVSSRPVSGVEAPLRLVDSTQCSAV